MTKAAWAFAEAARSKEDASSDGAPEEALGTEAAPNHASSGSRPSDQEPGDPDAPTLSADYRDTVSAFDEAGGEPLSSENRLLCPQALIRCRGGNGD
jgi:hypothetical protein